MKWVNIGDQVAAHAIGINKLDDVSFLDRLFPFVVRDKEEWIAIQIPTQRRVWDAQVGKDTYIKLMLAKNEFVHSSEKCSGFSALDNSVIVCTAYGYCLTDAKLRQRFRSHCLVFSRIFNRACCDDYGLSGHQA